MADNKWECPKCGTGASGGAHGKGECYSSNAPTGCDGLICDCEDDCEESHGLVFADPCRNARCYHCGWGGTLPVKPKGLAPWEKKALAAGWTPPKGRA